jgi:CheY-like chemotaxis protein
MKAKMEPRAGKSVLCVEDEELQLKLRRLLFEGAGYVVLQARSGQEAKEIFRSHEVDAVVMDYSLVDEDGLAVAHEMKKFRPQTPIIILSGSSSPEQDGDVVDSWFRKADIDPEDFVERVKQLIDLRGRS